MTRRRAHSHRREASTPTTGFTLVEMLVVLIVLALTAGLLLVNIGGDPRRALQHEATRFAGALEQAVATAQWRGETLGVSADGPMYRFWRRDGDRAWQVLTGDDVLTARALPTGMRIRPLRYAGAPIAPDAIVPLRPSGRNEPFTVRLATDSWSALVSSDPGNRVSFTLEHDASR